MIGAIELESKDSLVSVRGLARLLSPGEFGISSVFRFDSDAVFEFDGVFESEFKIVSDFANCSTDKLLVVSDMVAEARVFVGVETDLDGNSRCRSK